MTPDQLMAREARRLRLRLRFGVASPGEVELWADAWLLAFDIPHDALVDLALANKLGLAKTHDALEALGGADAAVAPMEIVEIMADIDAGDWPYERLDALMQDLSEWADYLVGKDSLPGWAVINDAYRFEGVPSDPPPKVLQESLRTGMLEVLKGARQFMATQTQTGSSA